MIPITDPRISDYLLKLTTEDDKYILEMEKIAQEKDFPIVERLVGRLLFVLTKLKKPKLIVELGSGFGYSAYWFSKAIDKGKVVLTDYRKENMDYAEQMFLSSGLRSKAIFRVGEAIEIARKYRNIDILFIDIEKYQYPEALQALLPNLNTNALIIADNTLWYGKVAEGLRDKETLGIEKFNHYLFNHKDFLSMILPLRDGVLISYKLT
jgi:caffeoyl-CoA O-methyltransferase